MGLNFSKQFLPIFLLIVLILVWTSVWSLFKIAIEAIPPLSFRVIIGIPAFALLLFLGFKKVKTVYIPRSDFKPLLLISFFNLSIIISLIFGMTGIIFLSLEINVFENMLGFLITLSAGLSWAIGTMIVKYGGIRSDGLIVAGWQQIIGIVPIIPFALYFDLDNFGLIDYRHILIIIYGIFLSSAYTYWAYFTILQKFSVNVTSISVMAVPILAILVDYVLVDVKFSGFDLLALIFIVSGIYVVATKPFNKRGT